MKFLAYGSVLALAVSKALSLSLNCMLENVKYGSCVTELQNVPDVTSAESMTQFCKSLNSDGCKSFVADANKTSTSCDINDDNDKELASLIFTARIGYLAYCVNDSEGKQCPLSEYLLKQTSALQGQATLTKPTPEELNIFVEDCKKEPCNKRLTDLIEVVKAFSKAKGNDVSNTIPPEVDMIIENYKNKKCENVIVPGAATNTTVDGAAATVANNGTNVDANAKPDDDKSAASTFKTISSTISIIILLAIVFF